MQSSSKAVLSREHFGGMRGLLKLCTLLFFCAACTAKDAPDSPQNTHASKSPLPVYQSPVAYTVSLAGNFGEPRPHHFHGGIDVKTDGVEGKPVYSIADGYVSRITVGLFGFGNAVYVNHPEGYTSVYCHLKSFTPRIHALLRAWQYKHETYVADVRLRPTDCPVSSGQLIAISGNSGASQAPHLHFEIHDTRTSEMLDPLDFIGVHIKDGLKPMAHGFMACPKAGEGVFNGGTGKQTFGFASHHLTRQFTAWGKVGFAIWANDYMEITYNRYGVCETVLRADGREVFRSRIDRIPGDAVRMVNSWGDYEHWYRSGVWYMKSFTDPGNTLPFLKTDKNRGYIDFNQERDYKLEYILRDYYGNEAVYTFTVTGKKSAIPAKAAGNPRYVMKWNQTNTYALPGMQLVIPYGLLCDDMTLQPMVTKQDGKLSDRYTFYPRSYPLSNWAELSIAVRQKVKDPSKLYLACRYGMEHFQGGQYKDGWVTGRLRELGAAYELDYDDEPPVVHPVALGERIVLGMSDGKSGIRSYKGYVDGRFVLFEEVPKSPWVACNLADTWLEKTGKLRQLKFVVTDNRDNTCIYTTTIKY